MTLAAPLALALLALAVPIVWAYLRRPPPPPRTVSSLMLYRRMGIGAPPRKVRLRRLLSLVLVLTALVALAVGLAAGTRSGGRALIVLDDSASMGGGDRWELAQEHLDSWLSRHPGAEVGLIGAAPLRQHADFTTDHAHLREVAAALTPAGEGQPAEDLVGAWCPMPVVLLSDSILAPEGCEVERPDLGELGENAGITLFTAGSVDALGQTEVHVGVQATTPGPVELAFDVDGQDLGRETIDAPGARLFRVALPEGEVLTARILAEDGLAADDVVRAPLGEGRRVRVAIDDPDGFVATALRAHPRVDLSTGEGPIDLAVLTTDTEVDAPLVVTFGVGGAPVARPHITDTDDHDPLLEYVDLTDLRVASARTLGEGRVIVDSDQGPLVTRSPGRIAFAFHVEDSDLGLRVAFANLVANIVDEAVPPEEPGQGEGVLSPAETLSASLPAEGSPLPGGLDPWPIAGMLALAALLVEWRVER